LITMYYSMHTCVGVTINRFHIKVYIMGIKQKATLLRNLLCFSAAAQTGKINETAQKNGFKQSNLSNMIKDLEKFLGGQLLNRSRSGVQITSLGKDVLDIANDVEKTVYQLEYYSKQKYEYSGKIRLWTTEGVGVGLISSCLSEFYTLHPNIQVDIFGSFQKPRQIYDIDMGLIFEEPTHDDTVVIYKGKMNFAFYASQQYLSKYGTPKSLKDLQENHCICTRQNFTELSEWSDFIKKVKHLSVTTDSSNVLLSLILDGVGISILPKSIGRRHKDLTEFDFMSLSRDFWVVSHKESKDLPKVRSLLQLIRQASEKL